MVGFGTKLPKGRLPVFSVNTVDEARELITLTCPLNHRGQPYALELAQEQTLDNLEKFGDRLEKAYAHMKRWDKKPRYDMRKRGWTK